MKLDQDITLSKPTIQDLYNFCKERGALNYPINITCTVYDQDTDNFYDSCTNDLEISIFINVDNVNNVVDLFPER